MSFFQEANDSVAHTLYLPTNQLSVLRQRKTCCSVRTTQERKRPGYVELRDLLASSPAAFPTPPSIPFSFPPTDHTLPIRLLVRHFVSLDLSIVLASKSVLRLLRRRLCFSVRVGQRVPQQVSRTWFCPTRPTPVEWSRSVDVAVLAVAVGR